MRSCHARGSKHLENPACRPHARIAGDGSALAAAGAGDLPGRGAIVSDLGSCDLGCYTCGTTPDGQHQQTCPTDEVQMSGRWWRTMLDVIKARRSIRSYTSDPIVDEQIQTLLEAAMAAPSASNRQPWEFIVVRDAQSRQALSQVHPWAKMAAGAPVVVVVCGRPDVSRHWVEDCSAATENLLLAVTALGLGAVWVGVYPSAERQAEMRGILGIPDSVHVLCMVPLGHPTETRPPHTKYDPSKVHYDSF
jgi:nitroreductase